ncbi:hypothetical protein [Nocardiopsis sp. CNT312]|uniref:hypothetical protein n=1 Tax=Nocardiopsis sp. CNT312 TaxID=1137268 RepID=UPI00048F04CF|nr:hypothetical protein [Nocardiopsis sp. CNT312]
MVSDEHGPSDGTGHPSRVPARRARLAESLTQDRAGRALAAMTEQERADLLADGGTLGAPGCRGPVPSPGRTPV